MDLSHIDYIIIHCSDSDLDKDDSIGAIKALHIAGKDVAIEWGQYKTFGKGFLDVGYHYFIDSKGRCFDGRPLNKTGAHVLGYNSRSIGICISGSKTFYKDQFKTLRRVINNLKEVLPNLKKIAGHNYFDKKKTCPNFDVSEILE